MTLERTQDGWLLKAGSEERRITGKKAALMSLILADQGYDVRDDFRPFDAFTEESVKRGQDAAEAAWEREHGS